jgi:hypothetical protein
MPKFEVSKSTTAMSIGGKEYVTENGVLDIDDDHVQGIKAAHHMGLRLLQDEEGEKKPTKAAKKAD